MKSLNSSRCALCVCAAAILLAGCGGSQGLTGQSATAKQDGYGRASSELSGSEVLTASQVRIHTIECGSVGDVSFRTQGKAEGLLPGSFTAKGRWDYRIFLGWGFRELFTITSGSSQVLGKVSIFSEGTSPPMSCGHGAYFGPGTLYYKIHGEHKDQVLVNIIKRNDFSETLSDFRE